MVKNLIQTSELKIYIKINLFSEFDVEVNLPNKKTLKINKIKIPLLGIHNIKNSVAALGITLTVGIPLQDIKKGLLNFKGVQRRFNKVFNYNNIDFFDDYAHHPTEIKFVLDGVKKFFKNMIKFVFFNLIEFQD